MTLLTLTSDLSIGLWMSLIVILTTIIFCPVLYWLLLDHHLRT